MDRRHFIGGAIASAVSTQLVAKGWWGQRLDRQMAGETSHSIIQTGFHDLDTLVHGWHKPGVTIVASRPGMGKTTFSLSSAANCAIQGVSTAFFSLDLSETEIMTSMLASLSGINLSRLKLGNLSETEKIRLIDALNRLSMLGNNLVIKGSKHISFSELRMDCIEHKESHGLQLVFIDDLDRLCQGPPESRSSEIFTTITNLRALAKELEVAIVLGTQLSRSLEKRSSKRPVLKDLRYGNKIFTDNSPILLLYRDGYYSPHMGIDPLEVIVAENPYGSTGVVRLNLPFFRNAVF